MSVSLELLTEILAKAGISSSQEEEILTTIKNATTPSEAKEMLAFEEVFTSDKEQMCEKEIEEDEEGTSSDHHANERCIEHRFQVSAKLDRFCFQSYFSNSHFQYLILHIILYSRFSFSELKDNLGLLLLDRWLHWKFHFM